MQFIYYLNYIMKQEIVLKLFKFYKSYKPISKKINIFLMKPLFYINNNNLIRLLKNYKIYKDSIVNIYNLYL